MKSSSTKWMRLAALVMVLALLTSVSVTSHADAQALAPSITTNKGCQETGQNPVFALGERLTLSLRVGSDSFSSASVALVDHTPSGQTVVVSLGQLATNQEQVRLARQIIEGMGLAVATPDEAREILQLKGAHRVNI